MNSKALDDFVHNIIEIKAMTPGMGSASAGIVGAGAIGDRETYDLKRKAIAFAAEYRSQDTVSKQMTVLAHEMEGSLQVLSTLSVITEDHCDQLRSELQDLLSA
jgi:hypothetical protein